MFTNKNDFLVGRKPVFSGDCVEPVAVRFKLDMATADLATGTIGAIGILPYRTVPVSCYVDSDALDSGNAITASIGLLNADETALDIVFGAGLTIAQAGGQVPVYSKELARTAESDVERKIGILFTAGASAPAAGEIGVTMLYREA